MLVSRQGYANHPQYGFTLIELVVGIVIFSIAMVMVSSVLLPQAKRGIDPLWQVRAVTLAQSLMSELNAKAFDENAITGSGLEACTSIRACTNSANLGFETGEVRASFDDIDDYHGLVLQGVDIANSTSSAFSSNTSSLFLGFEARISVFYDDNYDGINDDDTNGDGTLDSGTLVGERKLIQIQIITPDGEFVPFATYRDNY